MTGEEVAVGGGDLGVVEGGGVGDVKGGGRGPNCGNWGRRSEKPPENGLVAGWMARLELKMVGRRGPRGGGEGARGFEAGNCCCWKIWLGL